MKFNVRCKWDFYSHHHHDFLSSIYIFFFTVTSPYTHEPSPKVPPPNCTQFFFRWKARKKKTGGLRRALLEKNFILPTKDVTKEITTLLVWKMLQANFCSSPKFLVYIFCYIFFLPPSPRKIMPKCFHVTKAPGEELLPSEGRLIFRFNFENNEKKIEYDGNFPIDLLNLINWKIIYVM